MRRNAIDVARVLALIIVVLGHLSLAVIDRSGGDIRGANLLALYPGWAFVAALAPMPVFFAAAGWAHTTSSLQNASARLSALIGLGAVVVGVWSAAVIAAVAVSGGAGVLGDGARIATQPLWFVAGYAALVPLGSRLASLAQRNIPLVVGLGVALLAGLDIARFSFDVDELIGWPGFYLAWTAPWILGAWWRQRYEAGGFDEKRVGLSIAAGAMVFGVVLCVFAGYSPAMIDAVPGARSNTTPPSLYTAVAAIGQVGGLMLIAPFLDGIGARWRRVWDRAGEMALGIYAWHLTALSLCGAVIAAGFPTPERLTTVWWATRPLWFAAVLGVAAGFVLLTSVVRAKLRRRSVASVSPTPSQSAIGAVLAVGGGALVGLRGPRSAALAAECAALFIFAWLLLRARATNRSGGSSTPARTTRRLLPKR